MPYELTVVFSACLQGFLQGSGQNAVVYMQVCICICECNGQILSVQMHVLK